MPKKDHFPFSNLNAVRFRKSWPRPLDPQHELNGLKYFLVAEVYLLNALYEELAVSLHEQPVDIVIDGNPQSLGSCLYDSGLSLPSVFILSGKPGKNFRHNAFFWHLSFYALFGAIVILIISQHSVADTGSVAFLTPGSGMNFSRIRDELFFLL
jgi:hypothetical protein